MPDEFRNVGGRIVPREIAERVGGGIAIPSAPREGPRPSRGGGGGAFVSPTRRISRVDEEAVIAQPIRSTILPREPTPKAAGFIGRSGQFIPAGQTFFETGLQEAQAKTVRRVEIASQFAPTAIKKAQTPKQFEQALQLGKQRKVKAERLQRQRESAVVEFQRAGLIEQRGTALFLTPRGQALGTQKLEALEEGAFFGKSLDFIIRDSEVFVLPQGTRDILKKTKQKELFLVKKGEKQFVLTETKGKDIVKGRAFDPITFSLGGTELIPIRDIAGIPKEAKITSFVVGKRGLDITLTGLNGPVVSQKAPLIGGGRHSYYWSWWSTPSTKVRISTKSKSSRIRTYIFRERNTSKTSFQS